jgi:hypothetical protein
MAAGYAPSITLVRFHDFGLRAIRDDEALPLAGASQLRFDRQGNGVDIRPLAPFSRFQRSGDFRTVQSDDTENTQAWLDAVQKHDDRNPPE